MAKYHFDKEKHLHFLDNKPLTGTSSIGQVLSKPLTWWASRKALEVLGWSNPKKVSKEERLKIVKEKYEAIKGLTIKKYLKLLDKAYRAHYDSLKESADEGTDLHAELERFVKSRMGKSKENQFDEKIKPFIQWSDKNIKEFLASESHCYSERLWIGGIVDAVAKLSNDKLAVIDFKSSKEAYITQFIQACLYAIQINENGLWSEDGQYHKETGLIEKIIIIPFGADKLPPNKELTRNVNMFQEGAECAVTLYRLMGLDEQIKNNL